MSHGNNGKGMRTALFFVDLLRFGKLGVASDLRGVRTEVYYDALQV